jgi:N-acetylneuraminic acid mutarotase
MLTTGDKLSGIWPDLPEPVSNNAVAAAEQDNRLIVFSLLGIGSSKLNDAITNAAYMLDAMSGRWSILPAVPGLGRLASTAQCVAGRVYLFGGYTVNVQAAEHSLPNLDIYSISTRSWTRGSDIPIPVDDSVSGVYRNRYIYLISGWSESDNVELVQVYDTVTNIWQQATPIAGTPVFGHAGSIIGDQIIYCDGAYRSSNSFVASNGCWLGSIDSGDLTRITWNRLAVHPGAARFRIAAGADLGRGKVWFVGGTNNPYNYNGIGYNGEPSEPSPVVFSYDVSAREWQLLTNSGPASMDHRGLIVAHNALTTVGGMEGAQQVNAHVRSVMIR